MFGAFKLSSTIIGVNLKSIYTWLQYRKTFVLFCQLLHGLTTKVKIHVASNIFGCHCITPAVSPEYISCAKDVFSGYTNIALYYLRLSSIATLLKRFFVTHYLSTECSSFKKCIPFNKISPMK